MSFTVKLHCLTCHFINGKEGRERETKSKREEIDRVVEAWRMERSETVKNRKRKEEVGRKSHREGHKKKMNGNKEQRSGRA